MVVVSGCYGHKYLTWEDAQPNVPNVPLHSIPDKLRFSQLNGCAHEKFPGLLCAIHHPLNKPGHFDAICEGGNISKEEIIKRTDAGYNTRRMHFL